MPINLNTTSYKETLSDVDFVIEANSNEWMLIYFIFKSFY